jgi:hypothetical protein
VKYGIYTFTETNVITSWIFKLEDRAEEQGFTKIAETKTQAEADKIFRDVKIYKYNR